MSSSPTSSSSSDADHGLEALAPMADVVCGVDFIIGTSQMTVSECLQLGRHSVVRLTETAGSDFDVRVHGVSIAQGEVAVVDDMAAVRISRLTVPSGVGWD
jgi:flagellar motor switch/type III secretory pathway protein FliN